jgi:hypothetical protein
MTVLSLLALRSLGFTAYTFGLLLAVFGITSLIGASIAPWCGARLGSGRVIILARVAYPMGCWQALTPDELLSRTNATRRSANRTMAALGALIAGLVVGLIGDRPTLIGVTIVFAAAALIAALSPLREAPSRGRRLPRSAAGSTQPHD